MYYAHTSKSSNSWHLLSDHLKSVGELAASFAMAFDCADEGRAAGLLHDLGKYGDLFQRRLEGKERGIDHWSVGAREAMEKYGLNGIGAALAIYGHHLGLNGISKGDMQDIHKSGDAKNTNRKDSRRLSHGDNSVLITRFANDQLHLPGLDTSILADGGTRPPIAGMLDARMLFSSLVDADYLDTEAHFSREADGVKRIRKEGPPLEAEKALELLITHLAKLAHDTRASETTLSLRKDLLDACLQTAQSEPGLFTLSAPTGAGKTLAMLAFALKHAKLKGLRRIIMVIPYLSIIEQTASVYRSIFNDAFGDEYVLEDHSLSDSGEKEGDGGGSDEQDEQTARRRALAENWDAPLIVTTSVKFFESLFTNKPGRARKLHRIAQSVIFFDEAQTLPAKLAIPTLAALSHLASNRYKCTVVFATATQPAFTHLDSEVEKLGGAGWTPREIAPPALKLFERAKRVKVAWPKPDERLSWHEIAHRLESFPQSLCIVNVRKSTQSLSKELSIKDRDNVFHLSTYMCPAHREKVLDDVRTRLKRGAPVQLVSTQCVEAGVDLDFPVVYRAFAPLESITQAAGRCNRNGLLLAVGAPVLGDVFVFYPEEGGYPKGYEQAVSMTEALIKEIGGDAAIDITSPELFERYYRKMYDITGTQENLKMQKALKERSFIEVAKEYKLIENATVNALVPYDPAAFISLRDEAESKGISASWIRRARKHTINIYRNEIDSRFVPIPVMGGRYGQEESGWFYLGDETCYDPKLGLLESSGAHFG